MSRQAIVTKYLGPTNTRGARVKASCEAGSLTVSWDYALNPEDNHKAAARALIRQLGWEGNWVMGSLAPGFVFVCGSRAVGLEVKTPHPQAINPLYRLTTRRES